jgi:LysR family glycine cleavage system transcriptional activator
MLLSRLHQFYEHYPVSLEIDADMTPANFKSDAVDIAILLFGLMIKINSTASVQRCDLSRDQPGFDENRLRSYSELCGLRLLHDSMPQNAYSTHWRSPFCPPRAL